MFFIIALCVLVGIVLLQYHLRDHYFRYFGEHAQGLVWYNRIIISTSLICDLCILVMVITAIYELWNFFTMLHFLLN